MKESNGYTIGSSSSTDNGTMVLTTFTLHSIARHGRSGEPALSPVTPPVRCQSCQCVESVSPLSVPRSLVSSGSLGSA